MCELAAKPSPNPTPAAACSGGTPGPPSGIGGKPDTSCASRAVPTSPSGRRPAGRIVEIFGSAPCSKSNDIAPTSPANAARQNGVAPISSTPARSKLYSEYHTFLVTRRPGHVERGIERRHAVGGGRIRIGALIEQPLREIEVPVDGGDQ